MSVALLALAGLATGCFSPQKKVAEKLPELREYWNTNVLRLATLPEAPIDWPVAVALMRENNLKLRRARADIITAQEWVRQVYKDLLPTLNLRSGISRRVGDISQTALDDVTFSLDSFFNVPGIVNLSTRLFAARLGLMRAETVYELARREQTIDLYKLFLAFQEVQELAAQLAAEEALAEAILAVDELTGQTLLKELRTRRLALAKDRELLQDRASDLLGSREARWVLQTNGWPRFLYDRDPLPLTDTNRVGQLQMRLVALELVGAWARLKGIQLRYWPELTLFVTGPPIYQRGAGRERFWDADDIRLSADFFWRLDTRGQVVRQLRQTRREQELHLARLQEETLDLIDKMLDAQILIGSLREQIEQLNQLIRLWEQAPLGQDFAALLAATDTTRSLRDQARKLRREMAELNTLFWFVDEQQWSRLN